MKIAYVTSRFPHLYQTFVRREIREVVAKGHDVTVFPIARPPRGQQRRLTAPCSVPASVVPASRQWRRMPREVQPIIKALVQDTIHRPSVFAKTFASIPTAIALADAVREGKFHHIHAHWSSYPTSAAWIASVITGVPFSFAFHAYDIYATRILVPEKIRAAAFAVANCRFTIKTLREFCADEDMERVQLIYNGVEFPDAFAPPGPSNPPTFAAVGQLVPTKGFSLLVDAWSQLHASGVSFRGIIVGDGPLRRSIRKQVKLRDLEDVVTLTGAFDERETRQCVANATALVVPCLEAAPGETHDGLPNVVIEAQAQGTPVIGSNVYGIPDAIEHEQTGLLTPPGDAGALADAMRRLLNHPGEANAMARRAYELAVHRFDIHRNVDRLLQMFEAVARSRRVGKAPE